VKKVSILVNLLAVLFVVLLGSGVALADAWKFGIISDTQWVTADPDHQNPNAIPASIIKQVNKQFINAGVNFVVAMGDMVDTGSQANDYVRALYAQDLYNAGIGFYPMRGNHEAAHENGYMKSDQDFWHAYPQIALGKAGENNYTPGDITTLLISDSMVLAGPYAPDAKTNPDIFYLGHDFSWPTANATNNSVSYSFNYKNATFVILDQFKSPDYYTSHIIPEQQDWISSTLSNRPANTHAFAFTHKNILGGNHKDNMFGGNAAGDPGDGYALDPVTGIANTLSDDTIISNTPGLTVGQKRSRANIFLSLLQTNNVKYMISGHDHHHYNSVVTSPDGHSMIHQLITQSDSNKFYKPGLPVSSNDMPVEQDLACVGYYIFTVDGPRVTIDYYASDQNNLSSFTETPTFTFSKRSTTGYSLNGKEFLIDQGGSYTTVHDKFKGTAAHILDGINSSTATTNYGKATVKAVNTGWTAGEAGNDMDFGYSHRWPLHFRNDHKARNYDMPASDILTLWGMADLGTDQTGVYTLSMSYDFGRLLPMQFGQGMLGLATRDENGDWVNAVDMNFGGTKKFVFGPWKKGYELGTYGIDPKTYTAWAVINYTGDFAVAGFRHF